MTWEQASVTLPAKPRGFHIVTNDIVRQVPALRRFRVGLAQVFLQHTSASLAINESADPDVRVDMESHFNQLCPDNAPHYVHTIEGPDDMPAHLKCALLGVSLTIPIADGRLALGTWQGIWLCEHRDHGGPRRVVVTLMGETTD